MGLGFPPVCLTLSLWYHQQTLRSRPRCLQRGDASVRDGVRNARNNLSPVHRLKLLLRRDRFRAGG